MKKVLFLFLLILVACPVFVLAEQIDINSATLSQLDELTGIGPTYAQRIIDNRPYSSVDGLLRVKGIGSGTLQKIKNQGFACVNCITTQTNQTMQQSTQPIAQAPSPSPSPTSTPAPVITYSNRVAINEVMPNPSGADETDEWFEIFNSDNSNIDLSDWKIKDTAGTISTFSIPKNTEILANNFSVFKRPETKIMLNNDEDGLTLYYPDGKIADLISFTKAPLNESYNKTSNGWKWSTTPTPGSKNIITATATKSGNKTLSKTKNSGNNDLTAQGLADISQGADSNQESSPSKKIGEIKNPWFLFFIVLATTIIIAAIILLIKFKILKKHVRT